MNTGDKREKSFYIHTFGCQMNQADTGIITTLLRNEGYSAADAEEDAGIILLNTCAVRENAVDRIENCLQHLQGMKKRRKGLLVGVIGCIPQHRREEMFSVSPAIDFLAGPDTYRALPSIIEQARAGARFAALDFNAAEMYEGIDPERPCSISAFVPVMRGCDNMCAFCVVPFTRGRERSHAFSSVISEIRRLASTGYREITLLGQNVNSYLDPEEGRDFAGLLAAASIEAPETRIRFTTSHPKDITERLVRTIAEHGNICSHIHLPVQSGSSRMLALMNRGHSAGEYRAKIEMIRSIIPGAALSTDIIAGFCSENEDDHQATLQLLSEIRFDSAFMFFYSARPGTLAARTLPDDVPEAVKKRRLQEIIDLQNEISAGLFQSAIGTVVEVLAESESRRSSDQLMGRTATNRVVVFDREGREPGELVNVMITGATSATLTGKISGS
ncbi:MAG: tRNA (N6-isopentenyl adenosine(37)-C2)-methylthiotransferase MiaB [Chlorobiaceae bacterium]|nr:tRNA (N6-isopentenyl adenosine(37)-C2)-methylthiotransferase MiaB [Chlorobiaceae bacterium]NTW09984.1 tRNA (N6-isopentenyl adenosine(37)-C2)-methylthiotransferase MiaB [Chlorobiaceae bacterium]